MPIFFDPTYILVIIASIICLMCQLKVNSAYSRYSRVPSQSGMTGASVAQNILRSKGIYDVQVVPISGQLSDHYDPSSKVVALSQEIYSGTSIASLAVAAHECGHAIQHAEGYAPISIRSNLLPFANIGSSLGWIAIMIGLIFGSKSIAMIGMILLGFMLAFQVVTLPVEFNASDRALHILQNDGYLMNDENDMAKSMLTAAALTYVAAVASTLLNMLRMLILISGNSRRR